MKQLKVDLKLGMRRVIYFKTSDSDSDSDSKPSQDNSDLIYISKSHDSTWDIFMVKSEWVFLYFKSI